MATAAEVTRNGGLEREAAPDPLNSGLRIIESCHDLPRYYYRCKHSSWTRAWMHLQSSFSLKLVT